MVEMISTVVVSVLTNILIFAIICEKCSNIEELRKENEELKKEIEKIKR